MGNRNRHIFRHYQIFRQNFIDRVDDFGPSFITVGFTHFEKFILDDLYNKAFITKDSFQAIDLFKNLIII